MCSLIAHDSWKGYLLYLFGGKNRRSDSVYETVIEASRDDED